MISLRDAWGAELIDIRVIPAEAEPAPAAAAMVLATRSVPTRAPRGSSSSPPGRGDARSLPSWHERATPGLALSA